MKHCKIVYSGKVICCVRKRRIPKRYAKYGLFLLSCDYLIIYISFFFVTTHLTVIMLWPLFATSKKVSLIFQFSISFILVSKIWLSFELLVLFNTTSSSKYWTPTSKYLQIFILLKYIHDKLPALIFLTSNHNLFYIVAFPTPPVMIAFGVWT